MNTIRNFFELLAKFLIIPFIILVFLGDLVSGVWLAILGDWGSIGYGIFAMFSSSILLPLIIMPTFLFAGPSALLYKRGVMGPVYLLTLLQNLYVLAVITAWCGGVLYFFSGRASGNSIIPVLIWSFGVALGPWQWMARKEAQSGGGDNSIATTFFTQIGYVAMILMIIFMKATLIQVISVFVIIMLFGIIFRFTFIIGNMQANQENHSFTTVIARIMCYTFLGLLVVLVAANQLIWITGSPNGEHQGIITFFISEKIFRKRSNTALYSSLEGRESRNDIKKNAGVAELPHHMVLSYQAVKKAESIFTKKTLETFNSSDLQFAIAAFEQALVNAELVSDSELDRIHPEMRVQFVKNTKLHLIKLLKGLDTGTRILLQRVLNFTKSTVVGHLPIERNFPFNLSNLNLVGTQKWVGQGCAQNRRAPVSPIVG